MRRYLLPLVVSGVVAGLLPLAAVASAAPGQAVGSRPPAPAVVRLLTGDSVRLATLAGRPEVSVVAAQRAGITGRFQTVHVGRDSYVIPAEAQPFLGRLLDPSLFEVSTLAGLQRAGRTPVTIDTTNGARVHVPGLVVTGRSNTVTRGYLTARGAAALRTALVVAARTALRPGGSVPVSLFGGVRHLAVTGAAAPAPTPQFQMYTLKIKVLNAAGRPAAGGEVGVINTDDGRKYVNFVTYEHGAARISVPAGHYSAITDVLSANPRTFAFADRIVPIANFAVTDNDQTLTLDARTATSRVAVHTPRPAHVKDLSVEFDRFDTNGRGGIGDGFEFEGRANVLVAPTRQARFGQMQWSTQWSLAGRARGVGHYSYDLSFFDDGQVGVHQSHTVAAFQLATVHARYYTDRQGGTNGLFLRFPIYPTQSIAGGTFLGLHIPLARTEYIYGGQSAVWQDLLIPTVNFRDPFAGIMSDGLRRYLPGSQRNSEWLRGPLAPGTEVETNGDGRFVCRACRTVHRMSIGLYPTTDSTPGHVGSLTSSARFSLYRGSKLLGHGDGAVVTVPALTGHYRVHMTTRRHGARASTATITDMTFRSAAGTGAPLPDGWVCPIRRPKVCTVLPLLHARVPLPTTLTDRLPVGTSSFVLTIAPIQGARHASITTARFATRLPGGKFRPAGMQRIGNGKYRVTLTNPRWALGRPVAIRVVGRDAAGDSINQTTRAAYFVGRR